jgi:hypothetical protein
MGVTPRVGISALLLLRHREAYRSCPRVTLSSVLTAQKEVMIRSMRRRSASANMASARISRILATRSWGRLSQEAGGGVMRN